MTLKAWYKVHITAKLLSSSVKAFSDGLTEPSNRLWCPKDTARQICSEWRHWHMDHLILHFVFVTLLWIRFYALILRYMIGCVLIFAFDLDTVKTSIQQILYKPTVLNLSTNVQNWSHDTFLATSRKPSLASSMAKDETNTFHQYLQKIFSKKHINSDSSTKDFLLVNILFGKITSNSQTLWILVKHWLGKWTCHTDL